MNKIWCDSEKELLEAVYAYLPTKVLAQRFGTSYKSIEDMSIRLNLKKCKLMLGDTISEGLARYNENRSHEPTYENGKKMIYVPGHPKATGYGRVAEHILVMEKILNRYLREGERVFHKDEDLKNNSPDNLYIVYCKTIKSVNTEEIIEKRKQGTTISELKKEYHMTNKTLYKILEAAGCVRKIKE